MNESPEHDPVELLRAANPASAETLRAEVTSEGDRSAKERAIRLAEQQAELPDRRSGWRGVRNSRALGVGGLALAAAAAGVIILIGGTPVGSEGHPEFAGAAVEVAEANPRLLVGAPGWSVSRADEFEPEQGSMEFTDGQHTLSLNWSQPPSDVPTFDLTEGSTPELGQWYRSPIDGCATREGNVLDCELFLRDTEVEVLGETAIVSEHRSVDAEGAASSFTAVLSPQGRINVFLSARLIPRADLVDVLGSLYRTDVETWLEALPPKIVQPLERPEVVDEMLADVPIPASVDVEELKDEASAASRYHLGAAVTGAVACGWLDQWAGAVESRDSAAADAAVEAMSSSREWAILNEMREQGGWSQVIWEYSRFMANDDRDALLGSSGTESYPDGSVYELSPSYASGLGCDSEERTLIEEGSGREPRPPGGRLEPVDGPSKP